MSCACISNEKKMFISAQTALIAFILFNPIVFQLMRGILGAWVASTDGCPTVTGVLLHAVVFGVIVYLLMLKPKKIRQTVQSLPLQ